MNASAKETREMDKMSVGILVFDEVEVLDFSGPFEVFSRTRTISGTESRRSDQSAPFTVKKGSGERRAPACLRSKEQPAFSRRWRLWR